MTDPFGRQTFREPKSHFGSNHGFSRSFRIFLHRLFPHHIIKRTLGYNRVIPLMIFAIDACLVGRNDKLRVLGVFVRHALVHSTVVILILLLLFAALIFIDLSVTAYDRLQTGTSLHIQCILVHLNLLRMEQLLIALILLLAGFEQVHCDRLHTVIMLMQIILMSLQQSACIDSSYITIVQLVKPRLR